MLHTSKLGRAQHSNGGVSERHIICVDANVFIKHALEICSKPSLTERVVSGMAK